MLVSSLTHTQFESYVSWTKTRNGLHTWRDKVSVAVRLCQVPMLWLQKNIQALKPGQYVYIRAPDFRSAAGCSHHKDKSHLTFAAWSPRQGFTEQERPNITVQPHCPAQTAVNRGASEHPAQSTSSQTPSCPAPRHTALAAEVTACCVPYISQLQTGRISFFVNEGKFFLRG